MKVQKLLVDDATGKRLYTREHCVPTKVLFPLIVDALEKNNGTSIKVLIEKFCRVAYLTRGESATVDELYRQRMPAPLKPSKRGAWLARYREFDIKLVKPPRDFEPDLGGRPAEMAYASLKWTGANAADEVVKLWRAGLRKPGIPIRAILVGYSHSNCWMSEKCKELWDAAAR